MYQKLTTALSGRPRYLRLHLSMTLFFFSVWCLVGFLLPEEEWERSKEGVWGGYNGKSSYCEQIRHQKPSDTCLFAYCNAYPGLTLRFCNNRSCQTKNQATACLKHWNNRGSKESRSPDPYMCTDSAPTCNFIEGPQTAKSCAVAKCMQPKTGCSSITRYKIYINNQDKQNSDTAASSCCPYLCASEGAAEYNCTFITTNDTTSSLPPSSSTTTTTTKTSTFMAQPVNSLSNYTFVAFGFIILSLFFYDLEEIHKTNKNNDMGNNASNTFPGTLQRFPLWSLILSLAMMMIGTTSFLFHASLTPVTQTLDVAAIYQGLGLLLLSNLCRFCIPSPLPSSSFHCLSRCPLTAICTPKQIQTSCCSLQIQFIVNYTCMIFGVFVACPLFYIYKQSMNSTAMLAILVLSNVFTVLVHYLVFRPSLQWKWMCITLISFAIAVLFRQSEGRVEGQGMIPCDPVGLWQGHSAWHYLCAQSYFSGYVFFRSEKYATTSVLGLEEDVAGLDIEIPSKVKGREKEGDTAVD